LYKRALRALFFAVILLCPLGAAGQSPFFDYCREGNLKQAKLWLKKNPQSLNKPNDSGFSPLILAVYRGQDSLALWLINQGADPNYQSPEGTALMAAVYAKRMGIMQQLFAAGANPNLTNSLGITALMLAAQTEQPLAIEVLLNMGANPKQGNKAGKTAVDFARISNCLDCLKLLPETPESP
jgi:ankyrin repeat protein